MTNLSKAHKDFLKFLGNEGRSTSTLIAYEKDIEQLTEYLFKQGVNLVGEIELPHLQSFMKTLAEQGMTPKTISRKTNSTKTFFRFLQEEGHVEENVSELLRHPRVEPKAPRILSKLEYRALRDAARTDTRTFAIIEVLLQTGIRISELANIQLQHIKIDEATGTGTLFIPEMESHNERIVPLNKAAVSAIKLYLDVRPEIEENDHLFITKTGNPMLIRNIRATIDRFFKNAGIEAAKVNDLRHTFLAHHIKSGVSISYLSKIVGHKRVSTTEKYLQHIDVEIEEEKNEIIVL